MAPVGVCRALLYPVACWMYGWLHAAEKNSPSESYFFAPFAWIRLGLHLETISVFEELEKIKQQKELKQDFSVFFFSDQWQWAVFPGPRTKYNTAQRLLRWQGLRLSVRGKRRLHLRFVLPLSSPQKRVPHLPFWLFWVVFAVIVFCHRLTATLRLASARSG